MVDEEQAMIDGMNMIIDKIRGFRASDLEHKFYGQGAPIEESKISFLGETHNNLEGILESFGALNYFGRPRDFALFEGGDRRKGAFLCEHFFLMKAYRTYRWEQLGLPYDPKARSEWAKEKGFEDIFNSVRHSIDMEGLNLTKMYCASWDDDYAVNRSLEGEIDNYLLPRNESMVLAIDSYLPRVRQIFVIAGQLHLPWVEYSRSFRSSKNQNEFPIELDEYYAWVKDLKNGYGKTGVIKLKGHSGSTEPIYRYFGKKNIAYSQYIPRRIWDRH